MLINEDDELILFEESKGSYLLEDSQLEDPVIKDKTKPQNEEKGLFTIFGYNDLLDTILDELPATATSIMVMDMCIKLKWNTALAA